MTTETIGGRPAAAAPRPWRLTNAGRSPAIWLAFGFAAALLSVGGRWDLPLAAWLAPVFLLRFSRQSRPLAAIGLLVVVSVAAAMFWAFQLGIPLDSNTVVNYGAYGVVFALPYTIDRLIGPRLGAAGRLLLFPAALATAEYLLANFNDRGAAYGLRAITQNGNLALLQVVSVAGPYAIGFLIAWFGATVNWVWETASWSRSRTAIAAYAAVLAVIVGGGAARLAFSPPSPAYVRVAGISPDNATIAAAKAKLVADFPRNLDEVAQADPVKLQAAFDIINDNMLAQTREAAQAGAKIVVWSETAARLLAPFKPAFLAKAAQVAHQEGIYLDASDMVPFERNETHLIDPSGKVVWWYWKNHPVPGAEHVPPGHTPVPTLQTPYGRLANIICFDADFPALARRRADIMIVPGWDWPEIGDVHTLKMASLRAIENGYSMIRQDYKGRSAAFDPYGRVLASQDTTKDGQHLMLVDMPINGVATLYGAVGDVFAWLCVAGTALLVGLGLLRRRQA